MCDYVRYNNFDDLDDLKKILGFDNIRLEGDLDLYYHPNPYHKVLIPRGYYVVDWGKGYGGKEIIHPDIFSKRFSVY